MEGNTKLTVTAINTTCSVAKAVLGIADPIALTSWPWSPPHWLLSGPWTCWKRPGLHTGPRSHGNGLSLSKTHKDDSFCFPFLSFHPNFHASWNLFLIFFLGGEVIFNFVTSLLGACQTWIWVTEGGGPLIRPKVLELFWAFPEWGLWVGGNQGRNGLGI